MAYEAKVLEVMIASPADVVAERDVVRSVIAEWNDVHARRDGMVLLPVGWDTHSAPDLAGRPQQIINDRILKNADIVVGIFWTRIGSPTGVAPSGSVEEIQNHHKANKPVILYFSDMPVAPGSYDLDQYKELLKFKEWARANGLVSGFSNLDGFRRDFHRHLQITLRDNEYVKREKMAATRTAPSAIMLSAPPPPGHPSSQLSPEAMRLLQLAGDPAASHAMITIRRFIGGVAITAGKENVEFNGNRELAKWEAAVQQLHEHGLTRDFSGKREMFELNHRGFQAADALSAANGSQE